MALRLHWQLGEYEAYGAWFPDSFREHLEDWAKQISCGSVQIESGSDDNLITLDEILDKAMK